MTNSSRVRREEAFERAKRFDMSMWLLSAAELAVLAAVVLFVPQFLTIALVATAAIHAWRLNGEIHRLREEQP